MSADPPTPAETDPLPIDDPTVGLLDDEVREDTSAVVLAGQAIDPGNYPKGTFRGTISAMITMIVMIAATYVTPGLEWARPWTPEDPVPFWNLIGRELLGEGAAAEAADAETRRLAELARAAVAADDGGDDGGDDDDGGDPDDSGDSGERPDLEASEPAVDAVIPAYAEHPEDREPIPRRLENPERLDPFFAALTRTDLRLPGAVTRASHYGDSAIGNDGITSAIRAKLQARFGDAGHGFHLLGQPNASYRHVGVSFTERTRWSLCFIIHSCRSDGYYGFGGTTFESTGGAEVIVGTATKGTMGRRVSRFEVYYAAQPGGGNLRLKVDDDEPRVIATAAETLEDRWEVIEVDDGRHSLSIRAAGGGKVRAYGVTLERRGPGIVWDGLSQIGALTRRLLNWDRAHIRGQVARRGPDLIVLMFGGNDMNTRGTMAKYKGELRQVLELFRGGEGDRVDDPPACLVMAPLDHGERQGQQIVTRSIVPRIVSAQREVAEAAGCAFFDTFAAMGGEGAMGRWFRASPRLGSGDLAHLTRHGHRVIGAMLVSALLDGYRDFRRRVEGQPLRALSAIADHGIAVADLGEVDLDALVGAPDPEVLPLPPAVDPPAEDEAEPAAEAEPEVDEAAETADAG